MENPYDLSWLVVGIAAGVLSGSLRPMLKFRRSLQILITALGTFFCWRLALQSVQWAYEYPFNPNDGAAKGFVYLFGWLFGLLLLILPSFGLTSFVRALYKRPKR